MGGRLDAELAEERRARLDGVGPDCRLRGGRWWLRGRRGSGRRLGAELLNRARQGGGGDQIVAGLGRRQCLEEVIAALWRRLRCWGRLAEVWRLMARALPGFWGLG